MLRVNDQIATLRDYEERKAGRLEYLAQAPDAVVRDRQREIAAAGQATMRELYEELLVLSRSQQLRIEVRSEQIDEALSHTRQRYGIETDEQFGMALAQSGMTLAQFRARMERNLLYQEVVSREVHPRIKLSDDDLQRYYREHPDEFYTPVRVEVQELVVLESGTPDAEARLGLAHELRQQIAAGATLAEIAERQKATGKTSPVNEVGWVRRGELDAALEQVAFALVPGTISEPVAGRGGLHLVMVKAREEPRLLPYDEVKAELHERQREKLYDREMRGYLAELDQKALLVAEVPAEATGFREYRETEGEPTPPDFAAAPPQPLPEPEVTAPPAVPPAAPADKLPPPPPHPH